MKKGNHRDEFHWLTKMDCRNDPAWHVKNTQKFGATVIVSLGDEQVEVARIEDLDLRDKDGNLVTTERLDYHMGYLNGTTPIGSFSSQSSLHRPNQNQRAYTKLTEKLEKKGIRVNYSVEAETRDRKRILDSFCRQTMSVS